MGLWIRTNRRKVREQLCFAVAVVEGLAAAEATEKRYRSEAALQTIRLRLATEVRH